MSTAKKTNSALWKGIVSRIKSQVLRGTKAGQWSARKAEAAVKAYKKAGGGYSGKKSSENSLSKWSKQRRIRNTKAKKIVSIAKKPSSIQSKPISSRS